MEQRKEPETADLLLHDLAECRRKKDEQRTDHHFPGRNFQKHAGHRGKGHVKKGVRQETEHLLRFSFCQHDSLVTHR